MSDRLYIITGGPGAGKTALLEEFGRRGFDCVPEVARRIICEQMDAGGDALPWGDTKRYTELMLARSIDDYLRFDTLSGLYFFDRGIPDALAYAALIGLQLDRSVEARAFQYQYNPMVFLLPPWKEIYQADRERRQTYEQAVETYHRIRLTYEEAGYCIVVIPELPVSQRAEYVLRMMNSPVVLPSVNKLFSNR